MQYNFNFHSHTILSDGQSSFQDYLKSLKNINLISFGFSEHAPVPFESTWNMQASDVEIYFSEIERLRNILKNKTEIYAGFEVDFFEPYKDQILSLAQIHRLDYFIGSVHYLAFTHARQPWCIDGNIEEFKTGYQEIFNGNGKKLFRAYYQAVATMIEEWRPTIIGHIDKIRMYNHQLNLFDENDIDYKNNVYECLYLAKKYDIMIELNTRGTYKHPEKLYYPNYWILEEMHKLGIRVVVNSDCHNTDEILKNFESAVGVLKSIGFSSIWYLYDNKWQELLLN